MHLAQCPPSFGAQNYGQWGCAEVERPCACGAGPEGHARARWRPAAHAVQPLIPGHPQEQPEGNVSAQRREGAGIPMHCKRSGKPGL